MKRILVRNMGFIRLAIVLLLALVGTGCSITAGQVLEDRTPAPDFTLPNVDGGEISLKDLRGQVVAVYMTNL